MNSEEYQKIVTETAIYPKDKGLEYCALGLAGETGEVCEKIKKFIRDGQNLSDLEKELGDVLWYIAALSNELGLSLSQVMSNNYNKLIDRKNRGVLKGNGDNR